LNAATGTDSPSPARLKIATSRIWRLFARWDPVAWIIGAIALFLGAIFVVVALAYNQGRVVAPLDDVYIHLQYASQLGRGQFFQYSTGDPISTGASSFLYVAVLALAYLIGFRGDLLLPFAVSFGVLCFALTASCSCVLGRRLISKSAGVWSGLLVAVSGPVLWGAAGGMEVGFVAFLVACSILLFTKEAPSGRFRFTPVLASLLALARPEGFILAIALSGAACWTIIARIRRGRCSLASGFGGAAWSILPLFAGLSQLLFYKQVTGTAVANGIQVKSFLYDQPVLYWSEFIDRSMSNFRGLIDVFSGLSARDFTFPLAAFFAVLGIFYLATKRATWRPLVVALTVGLVVVFASVSTLNNLPHQNLRYVQPFIPVFTFLTVAGIFGLIDSRQDVRWLRTGVHALLAAALILSLSSLPTWALRLGYNAATIRETDVSVGHWIRDNLPPDAVVGAKDVGAVAYFGNHRVVDIVGLTTNNIARASNNGVGTLYEALRNLPARERPDYFVVYDTPPGVPIDALRESGVLGDSPLMTFDVKSPAAADEPLAVPFRRIDIYRADWRVPDAGNQVRVPGDMRDYLNVGDLGSEHAHSYEPQLAQIGMQPISTVRRESLPDGRQVIDSGRRIIGGERFVAHNVIPGRPLTITSRSASTKVRQDQRITALPDLLILVDDVPVGVWHRPYDGTTWNESSFTIPGALVTGTSVKLELAPPRQLLAPYPDYSSFGYWLSQ
jgi:hypothetical protein